MHHTTFSPTAALSRAMAAWNSKARELSTPVLHHIFASIANLQRLRAAIRQMGDVHGAGLEGDSEGASGGTTPDHADALEKLCARLDRLQETLTRLNEDARDACREGESLVEDFLALPLHEAAMANRTLRGAQQHLARWSADGPEQELDANIQTLDRLIQARKADIETLNRQLVDAERWLSPRSGNAASESSPRSFGQIELQSVQEFVQNSPIASIPINASYYQRILEAASSPEGHKVPMGQILTAAGVVTARQLQSALDYQRMGRKQALGSLLVDLGYTTEDAIAQALAAQLALPYVVLVNEPVDPGAVVAIPVHMARRHACFPLNFTGHGLCVAMANPLDLIALEDLRLASQKHIRPCVAARGEIASHIERYYS